MRPEANESPPPTRSRISSSGAWVASWNAARGPGDRAPVVDASPSATSRSVVATREVRKAAGDLLDHSSERLPVESSQLLVDALDLEAERGGEVLLVADRTSTSGTSSRLTSAARSWPPIARHSESR